MKSKKDIYSVPDGYFDSLEMRLSYIPGKVEDGVLRPAGGRRIGLPVSGSWGLWRPAVMMPALAAIAIVLSVMLFFRPVQQREDSLAFVESFYACDLIPHTNPYMLYDESALEEESVLEETSDVSADDVVNYLIEDGLTVDMIEQVIY